jgi:hypothetical protein
MCDHQYPPPDASAIAAGLLRVTRAQLEHQRADALYDSAYCAGLGRGFTLGQFDDNEGLRKALESREGYLKDLREASAALAEPHDALTDAQILEIGGRFFRPGHNPDAEPAFIKAVRAIIAATKEPS